MATVQGMTSSKINEIADASIVSGAIDSSGQLIFTTRGGTEINAGFVSQPYKSYPVGSIYMSTVSTNPATLLGGGTWTAWGSGRVPVGVDVTQTEFNTVEKVDGEKTHTLTAPEIPPHTHAIDHNHPAVSTNSDGAHVHTVDVGDASPGTVNATLQRGSTSTPLASISTPVNSSGAHDHTVDLPNFTGNSGTGTGGGGAHNNLQPYITCYMWKRTA